MKRTVGRAKVIKELIKNTTVDENGEFVEENKKVTYKIDREPDFVKLYLDDLIKLEGLPKSTAAVFYELLKFMTYADSERGQIVILNSYVRKQILNAIGGISNPQTIVNAISALKRKGLLSEVDRATYCINPNVVGRGEWRDILNLRKRISEINVKIVYNEYGRDIVTETVIEDCESE